MCSAYATRWWDNTPFHSKSAGSPSTASVPRTGPTTPAELPFATDSAWHAATDSYSQENQTQMVSTVADFMMTTLRERGLIAGE